MLRYHLLSKLGTAIYSPHYYYRVHSFVQRICRRRDNTSYSRRFPLCDARVSHLVNPSPTIDFLQHT